MELTRKDIIALIISTSENDSPFLLTYDNSAHKGRVHRYKMDEDCWDLQYYYETLEYRLFGMSHSRGFQLVSYLNADEAVNVVPGFDALTTDISKITA